MTVMPIIPYWLTANYEPGPQCEYIRKQGRLSAESFPILLRMEMELVPETLMCLNYLTQLSTQEDFTECSTCLIHAGSAILLLDE
jgi:hypothetical protein